MSNTDTLVCQLRSLGEQGFPIAWRAADALTAQAREIEALRADAARWRYAVAPGLDQSMNWLDVYEEWDGEDDFTAAIDAALASGKAVQG